MPRAPEGERFPPCLRLRSRAEFDAVFARRVRASDGRITVYAAPNCESFARLGIAVSRRTGNAAFRNRVKRRVREVFRRHRKELPSATDFVIVPQPKQEVSFADIRDSFLTLAAKLRPRVEASRQQLPPTAGSASEGAGGTARAKRKHQVP